MKKMIAILVTLSFYMCVNAEAQESSEQELAAQEATTASDQADTQESPNEPRIAETPAVSNDQDLATTKNCNACWSDWDLFSKGNVYIGIFGGANFLQADECRGIKPSFQTGYMVAATIGYRIWSGFRLEAEYAYRNNSIDRVEFLETRFSVDGHFDSFCLMANLLWDLPLSYWGWNCLQIQPYIGTGIGYDWQEIRSRGDNAIYDVHNDNFAWQLIAGIRYPLFCNTEISLEYKYHEGGFRNIENHSVGVGLTYNFGSPGFY